MFLYKKLHVPHVRKFIESEFPLFPFFPDFIFGSFGTRVQTANRYIALALILVRWVYRVLFSFAADFILLREGSSEQLPSVLVFAGEREVRAHA